MSLSRRNGAIQVFSRLDKATGFYVWVAAKVERGQLNILCVSTSWNNAYNIALAMAAGQLGDVYNWLDPKGTWLATGNTVVQ